MSNQQSKRDDNRVPALLIHDSTGAETRQVRSSVANPNALPVELVAGGTGASASQVQGTAASNAAAVGNPVLVGAKYNLSTQTYDDGDVANNQADVNGNLKVREQYAPVAEDNVNGVIATLAKPTASGTYSGSSFIAVLNDVDISVKATPGNLLSVSASSINAAIRYLQLFNKASAPAGGDTAVFSWPIPAGGATAPASVSVGRDFFGQNGQYFSTGVAVGISTAAATFTAATTTDHVVNGTYV